MILIDQECTSDPLCNTAQLTLIFITAHSSLITAQMGRLPPYFRPCITECFTVLLDAPYIQGGYQLVYLSD